MLLSPTNQEKVVMESTKAGTPRARTKKVEMAIIDPRSTRKSHTLKTWPHFYLDYFNLSLLYLVDISSFCLEKHWFRTSVWDGYSGHLITHISASKTAGIWPSLWVKKTVGNLGYFNPQNFGLQSWGTWWLYQPVREKRPPHYDPP